MVKTKTNKTPKVKGAKEVKRVVVLDTELEYAVEYRKGYKWNQSPEAIYKYMSCKKCGQMTVVTDDTIAVTCSECVNEMVEPPEFTSRRQSSGRPAGWHFMAKYVDKDGNVFYRGKEQPTLKGKFNETVIEKKQKISKAEKRNMVTEANVKVHKLKKQLKVAKLKKDIKRLTREITKLSKIGRGKIPRSKRFK